MPLASQQRSDEAVVLAASAARTATGTGDGARIRRPVSAVVAILEVTNAHSGSGDTLDVVVQTRVGSTWLDVVAFTQVLGNGSDTLQHVAKVSGNEPQAMYSTASALAAGNVRHVLGDEWRAKWTIGGTGTFTFAVTIAPVG
jgi:hypothetical protein